MQHVRLTLIAVLIVIGFAACAQPRVERPAAGPITIAPTPQVIDEAVAAPVLASSASTQPAQAEQPALPSGHPDIAEIIKARQQQRPSGQLPAGHPDISQMKKSASTQPAKIGSLSIRAIQGTANGPAIGSLPVVVDLYKDDAPFNKMEAKLDEQGTLVLENIPVGLTVTPVVRVTYKDVEYTASGEVMDPTHPEQQIQVAVFESSEQQPAWQIRMQHVMLQPTADGVQVIEMLAIENPTDRAWIGKLGADNKRSTISFALPAGVSSVQLGDSFHDGRTKIEKGQIINQMALVPGVSQYRIGYTLPVAGGKADFAIKTAAPVQHLMVFLPDDATSVVAEGIESGGVADMGNGKTRYYKAADIPAGKQLKLAISNITATAAAATASANGETGEAVASSTSAAKLVAGAGGLAIFLVGGMFLLRKSPGSSKKS